MEKLEKTLVDNRDDVEYELKQAEEKKLDPPRWNITARKRP